MGLRYENLDATTRRYMIEEIDADIRSDRIYLSSYLSQSGQGRWSDMIRHAAASGNDDTLAAAARTCLAQRMMRRSRSGRTMTTRIPVNAAEVLAECEFNRYYVRGLCCRAIAQAISRLQVYRAKPVAQPRPESEAKIGLLVDPAVVLSDVRNSQQHGVETALGIPPGPGSGITLRIPGDRLAHFVQPPRLRQLDRDAAVEIIRVRRIDVRQGMDGAEQEDVIEKASSETSRQTAKLS